MDNDNTTIDNSCQGAQATPSQPCKEIAQSIIVQYPILEDALIEAKRLYVLNKWSNGYYSVIVRVVNRLLKPVVVIDKPQTVADQYIILRSNLYDRAQEGDTTAIRAWMELTEQERASEDVPPELVADAVAALRGMGSEYAATLPVCCGAAINTLIERAVAPLIK